MLKRIFFAVALFLASHIPSMGQDTPSNVIYVVDSIPVMDDPEEGNDINEHDIFEVNVIKNKGSLRSLGYEKFDGAIFIFTKAYRNRSEELRKIPSTKQMERQGSVWYYHGFPYNGKFIDYYYSGRIQSEGTIVNGKAEGLATQYFQNGKRALERVYSNGIANGTEVLYYEDGALKQKGNFEKGHEIGTWEMYFPNGQVKQRTIFTDDKGNGETTIYYSSGKVLAAEVTRNGKTTPDKRLEKIDKAMEKGHADNKEENYKSAIKNYTKAIEIDSAYAEAYFARGTVKLNDFQFEEAIRDFDKALSIEPFHERALSNRAFARIRKHQFGNSRELSNRNGVRVMASKDNPGIPANELSLICSDLKQAIYLGDKNKMNLDALKEFCEADMKK